MIWKDPLDSLSLDDPNALYIPEEDKFIRITSEGGSIGRFHWRNQGRFAGGAMVIINCEGGRIGELWWFNSDPGTPREAFVPLTIGIIGFGMVIKRRIVQWGTCGFGRDVTINWEPIDD